MTQPFETSGELLAGGVAGLRLADQLYSRGNLLSQLAAARVGYGAADMFEKGSGLLIADSLGLAGDDVSDEEALRLLSMTYEDLRLEAPEAILAINGLIDTLGPFGKSMLAYVKQETVRHFGPNPENL